MFDLESLIVIAAGTLAGLAIVGTIAAWCWKGWLDLKRAELAGGSQSVLPAAGIGNRIDIADLKERVKKLEAIAAGVDY
jgi:hypothetical protein